MAKSELNYGPETCGFCEGKGEGYFIGGATTCPICEGSGSILAAQPSKKCTKCDGCGTVSKLLADNTWEKKMCMACNGTGWAFPGDEYAKKAKEYDKEIQKEASGTD